jgi:hypothetical protein
MNASGVKHRSFSAHLGRQVLIGSLDYATSASASPAGHMLFQGNLHPKLGINLRKQVHHGFHHFCWAADKGRLSQFDDLALCNQQIADITHQSR